jgi:hypothetical protein
MSRAYRIHVNESERRVIRAGDEVRTALSVLEVLPRGEMAELLERELVGRGFRRDGTVLRRDAEGVTVTVDPACGEVTARAEASEQVTLRSERTGSAYDDVGPHQRTVRRQLTAQVREDIQQKAAQERERLERQATERLEGHLIDLQKELDQAVNRATVEALKRKAAQLGRVKDIQEDPATGSLSITVEV